MPNSNLNLPNLNLTFPNLDLPNLDLNYPSKSKNLDLNYPPSKSTNSNIHYVLSGIYFEENSIKIRISQRPTKSLSSELNTRKTTI